MAAFWVGHLLKACGTGHLTGREAASSKTRSRPAGVEASGRFVLHADWSGQTGWRGAGVLAAETVAAAATWAPPSLVARPNSLHLRSLFVCYSAGLRRCPVMFCGRDRRRGRQHPEISFQRRFHKPLIVLFLRYIYPAAEQERCSFGGAGTSHWTAAACKSSTASLQPTCIFPLLPPPT